MTHRSLLVLTALTLLLAACKRPSATPKEMAPVPTTTTQSSSAPAWIDNPRVAGPLAAVGIEGPNPLKDLAFQRTMATAAGRATLARDLESRLRTMVERLVQTSQVVAARQGQATAQKAQEEVVRQLTDTTLRGAQARQFWTDPATGNLFVLVVMDPALAAASTKESLRHELQSLGLGQAELQAALSRMDSALAATQEGSR